MTFPAYNFHGTQFFGLRIGRITTSTLSPEILHAIEGWREKNQIDCLYFLADPHHAPTAQLAAQSGFVLVDIRMEMDAMLPLPNSAQKEHHAAGSLRPADLQDLPALKTIAGEAFTQTRFYFDHRFSRDSCRQLYETWVENSLHNPAKDVLVLHSSNQILGFISGAQKDSNVNIDLVAVSASARGQGVGSTLIQAFCKQGISRGTRTATVPTQARNISAIRLYERCGFRCANMRLWYHAWYNTESTAP